VVPAVLVLAVPVLAWTVADAEPPAAPPPCDPASTTVESTSTSTTTTTTTIAPPVIEETTTTVAETTTTTTSTTTTTTAVPRPDSCATTTTPAPMPPESTATVAPSSSIGETTTTITGGAASSEVPTTTAPAPAPPPLAAPAPGPAEARPPAAAPASGPAVSPVPIPETIPPGEPSPPESTAPVPPPAPVEPPAPGPAPAEPAPAEPAPEDIESVPVVEQPRSAGGRSVAPSGVSDVGTVRPVVFPVAGPVRYGNDFGVCRDGCRRQHRGNDLIGDRLQPLVAMRDGVVDRLLDHPTAGFGVVIRDAEGWEYHQYHMNNDTPASDDGLDDGTWRFGAGIAVGARVVAGQVIGWMGDSGNSEGSVPHTHVEIHMPTGEAINPYWSLRAAQRDVNCGLTALAAPVPVYHPSLVRVTDAQFLGDGWSSPELLAELPGAWTALPLTGGRPTSDDVSARMWIGPDGFTPVDVAAAGVGDRRYDDHDCTRPEPASTVAPVIAVATAGIATTAGPPVSPVPIPADLGAILATIRAMETGGNYRTQITSSTASGAYAFLDGSWDGYGGYRRARDAPPAVQDAKAAWLARYILDKNNGDVTTIPVSWYIGHVPRGAEWDTVPPVGANVLTPREYQARWMAMYAKVLGTPELWVTGTGSWAPAGPVCRTTLIDLAAPGQPPAYGLTQVGAFADDGTGRAVPAAGDPCDPNRPVPAPPPPPPAPTPPTPPTTTIPNIALRSRLG